MKLLNRLLLLLPWRRRAAERDMRDERRAVAADVTIPTLMVYPHYFAMWRSSTKRSCARC